MSWLVYDTETSGMVKRRHSPPYRNATRSFGQILSFYGVLLEEQDSLSGTHLVESWVINEGQPLLCRVMPHIVPEPDALLANGLAFHALSHAPYSHYQMMARIHDFIRRCSVPPQLTVTGYNSLSFDEHFLRLGFDQSLLPVFTTGEQADFRLRGDLLHIARAAAHLCCDKIKTARHPDGRTSFRQGDFALANGIGFDAKQAHEVSYDVIGGAVPIARLLYEQTPEVWRLMANMTQRAYVQKRLLGGKHLVLYHVGVTTNALRGSFVSYAAPHTAYGSSKRPSKLHALFDLSFDPTDYLERSPENLLELFKTDDTRDRPVLLYINTGEQPCLLKLDEAAAFGKKPPDADLLEKRARLVRTPEFQARISAALNLKFPQSPPNPAPYLEDDIFATLDLSVQERPDDREALSLFHKTNDWKKRASIVESFKDERRYQLGLRLLGEHAPHTLSLKLRRDYFAFVASRLLAPEDVPWMTVNKAIARCQTLLETAPKPLAPTRIKITKMISGYQTMQKNIETKLSALHITSPRP